MRLRFKDNSPSKIKKNVYRSVKFVAIFVVSWWLFWDLFYPILCVFIGYDYRGIAYYRYEVEGDRFDGNIVHDFRRLFTLYSGYAIVVEHPMIYYYGAEGFVILNQHSPEIKVLEDENTSSPLALRPELPYTKSVVVLDSVGALSEKERSIYFDLKSRPVEMFPRISGPWNWEIREMYYNSQIPIEYHARY